MVQGLPLVHGSASNAERFQPSPLSPIRLHGIQSGIALQPPQRSSLESPSGDLELPDPDETDDWFVNSISGDDLNLHTGTTVFLGYDTHDFPSSPVEKKALGAPHQAHGDTPPMPPQRTVTDFRPDPATQGVYGNRPTPPNSSTPNYPPS